MQNPKLTFRDCNDCLKYVYDESSGERRLHRGRPLERPPGTYAPCAYGRCKKGSPDAAKTLTPRNWQAYEHYLECKATGHFPDDDIVRRNARIISEIEKAVEKYERGQEMLMTAISSAGRGR